MVTSQTWPTTTQLVKITHVFGHNKSKKTNDSGLLGEIVNAGIHSLRHYCCYWDIRGKRFKTN
jgi:hypothetical protein